MKISYFSFCGIAAALLMSAFVCPGIGIPPNRQSSVSPGEAIRRAAANEERMRAAEPNFFYRQKIVVQVPGEGGSVRSQLHRVSEMGYDDMGNRVEKIIEFPPSRLMTTLGVMKPDFKSLLGIDPFFLTTDALSRYSIKFVERQKIDELNTYAFDLEGKRGSAKDIEKDGWPFKGRVWVEDQDFVIVKVEGRALTTKDDRQRFPKFEYYRENVESNLWLPSFAFGEDVLDLPHYDLPVTVKINYTEYKRIQPRK